MTFVNHTIGGFAVGALLAAVFGWNWWLVAIVCALIGAFPDVGSWVFWKLWPDRWMRWEVYSYCHPIPGGGQWDDYGKWLLPWGLHTWVIDSIIHPSQPKFIFPQFPVEWANIVWIETFFGKEVDWTKWDVLYVALEAFTTVVYAFVIYWSI